MVWWGSGGEVEVRCGGVSVVGCSVVGCSGGVVWCGLLWGEMSHLIAALRRV